jgi:hypothetical protein
MFHENSAGSIIQLCFILNSVFMSLSFNLVHKKFRIVTNYNTPDKDVVIVFSESVQESVPDNFPRTFLGIR